MCFQANNIRGAKTDVRTGCVLGGGAVGVCVCVCVCVCMCVFSSE